MSHGYYSQHHEHSHIYPFYSDVISTVLSTALPPCPPVTPATLRALFRFQTASTPSDPHPANPPERCRCGGERTSLHILLDCPDFNDARNDLLPAPASQTLLFEPNHLPQLVTFLRRTGLGFTQDLRDRTEDAESEVEDLDVGPIEGMTLDLDL